MALSLFRIRIDKKNRLTDSQFIYFWIVRDQCCGSGIRCFFTPGIRIRDEFFPDLGSRIQGVCFWRDFLKNPCSLIFLLIKLAPETIKSKKKVSFIFHPYFYVQ
jgi:hypothetical protein